MRSQPLFVLTAGLLLIVSHSTASADASADSDRLVAAGGDLQARLEAHQTLVEQKARAVDLVKRSEADSKTAEQSEDIAQRNLGNNPPGSPGRPAAELQEKNAYTTLQSARQNLDLAKKTLADSTGQAALSCIVMTNILTTIDSNLTGVLTDIRNHAKPMVDKVRDSLTLPIGLLAKKPSQEFCDLPNRARDDQDTISDALTLVTIVKREHLLIRSMKEKADGADDALNDLSRLAALTEDISVLANALQSVGIEMVSFFLNTGSMMQLFPGPAATWESGVTVSGALTTAVGPLLNLIATKETDPGSKDTYNYAGFGVTLGGLAVTLAGQILVRYSSGSSKQFQSFVDRVSTNRVLGLSIQQMNDKVAVEKTRFANEKLDKLATEKEISDLYSNALQEERNKKAVLDPALSKAEARPTQATDLEKNELSSAFVPWFEAARTLDKQFAAVFSRLQSDSNAIQRKLAHLAALINTTDDMVHKLRDLLGATAKKSPLCKNNPTDADTIDFCKMEAAGAEHFATNYLSDDGLDALVLLGGKNLRSSRILSTSARTAETKWKKIDEAIRAFMLILRERFDKNAAAASSRMDNFSKGTY